MKFNDKQLENIARVAGAFCVSAGVGAAIGIARPESISSKEELALIISCIGAFCAMLYLLGKIK